MKGQWVGNYLGTNTGEVIIEIDELRDCFEGVAYLYDSNTDLPATFAPFRTPNKSNSFNLSVNLGPIDKLTGNPSNWQEVQSQYPGVTFPSTADTKWNLSSNSLEIKWTTNIGTFGTMSLPKSKSDKPSEIKPLQIHSWKDFKDFAIKFEPYQNVFRGQENSSPWRLRTHFHRAGRSDLLRFINQDIPELHRNLSHLTAHQFKLENPAENGSFFALAQHHGYPTPLLDWTYSPFVAAYFAYNDLTRDKRTDGRHVRIFIFKRKQWFADYPQIPKLAPARPHFSMLDIVALNNPRMVQQQALVSVTNIDDIESYIRNREQDRGQTYLEVIDLPASSRKEVMQELSLMGITAGSLFPGLDGVCRQLKERFFDL